MSLSQLHSGQQTSSDQPPQRITRPLSREPEKHDQQPDEAEQGTRAAARTLKDFWTKISNDWVFNLAAMLAYNLLMSIVPLIAMFLSFFGLFLGGLAPGVQQGFINGITRGLPGGGQEFTRAALSRLAASSGWFALVTIIVSAWFGSRLFVAIDQCFGIIFRLPPRPFLRQNAIALGMLLIFALLIPLLLAVSLAPSFFSTEVVTRFLGQSRASAILLSIISVLVTLLIASLLFLAIYTILPNRPLRVGDAWMGALVAGALLEVYSVTFPFYATHFLKPENYGSTAGFAVLILVFFYYFGIILLLGAEINSFWIVGQRQTATSLPGILYEIQARKSVEGAAGPTAGQPQENMQANRRGLDITMTPAEKVLKPPGPPEEQESTLRAEPEKEEQKTGSAAPD
jgi:membrane protein